MSEIEIEPLDFVPFDRLRRVAFGDGFVSIDIVGGLTDTPDVIVLSDGDAIDLAARIHDRLGGATGSLVGLALAAMSGFGAGIIFTLTAT